MEAGEFGIVPRELTRSRGSRWNKRDVEYSEYAGSSLRFELRKLLEWDYGDSNSGDNAEESG